MILSSEQTKIIEISKSLKESEILKINAFAGTGKTTTLFQLTNIISDKSFLYLAFSNDIVNEAKKKFKNNVFATTINSLAFKQIISINGYILSKEPNFTPVMIGEILQIDFSDAYDVLRIYHSFCNSDLKDINELKNIYIPKRLSSFEYAKKLFDMLLNKEIKSDHSFYLKKFELDNYAKNLNYDYILLDEAQDTNPVTLSIFNQLKGRKILVGDTHQTIYQFRDSINAMEVIPSNYTCYLSKTYRCNKEIVSYANKILKLYKKETVNLVSGVLNQDPTINETVYISRTNSEIINLIEKLDNFYCMKKIEDIFGLSIAIHSFIKNQDQKVEKYNFLNKFENIKSLEEYAKTINDIELSGAIRIAKMFKSYLFVLQNKAKLKQNIKSKNILITGHGSKGLEFDKVIVCKDFKLPTSFKTHDEFIAEANLLYVVVTRARKKVEFESEVIIDAIY